MTLDLACLSEVVREAFAPAPPNGWLLGWNRERYFREFAGAAAPARATNHTSFDYAFCTHFDADLQDSGDAEYLTLTVRISFIADVYSIHWTTYGDGGKVGNVVSTPRSEAAVELQTRIEQWLQGAALARLPDEWFELQVSGVQLELAGATGATLGKCLFEDYESAAEPERDITGHLQQGLARPWSTLDVQAVLARLQSLDSESAWDWDFDAGEDWARVLRDGRATFFVWARGALIIAASSGPPCSDALHGIDAIVLRVPDTEASCLSADRGTIERFAGRRVSEVLDDRCFSADDLVWATI